MSEYKGGGEGVDGRGGRGSRERVERRAGVCSVVVRQKKKRDLTRTALGPSCVSQAFSMTAVAHACAHTHNPGLSLMPAASPRPTPSGSHPAGA